MHSIEYNLWKKRGGSCDGERRREKQQRKHIGDDSESDNQRRCSERKVVGKNDGDTFGDLNRYLF